MIVSSEINRPALELAGYFEHFAEERIQIIGMVEYSYLESLEDEVRTERYRKLLDLTCHVSLCAGTTSRMKKCCAYRW